MSTNNKLFLPEFYDILHVLEFGKAKHGEMNFMEPDGKKSSHKDMHASAFRHIAESSAGSTADKETGLHPMLHAATRCLMVYARHKNNIKHSDDRE